MIFFYILHTMKKSILPIIIVFLFFSSINLFAKKIVISAAGDIMMHKPVKSCAFRHNITDAQKKSANNYGFDYLFHYAPSLFEDADIVMGNLEFPIAAPYKSESVIFNCHPRVLKALKKAGFTMLMLSNNHILDQGPEGITETIGHVTKQGFDILGVNTDKKQTRQGIIKKINGIKVGFLAYTGIINYPIPSSQKGYHINWFYKARDVISDIQEIRDKVDYLILSVHTGIEYETVPTKKDMALMRRYCDAGVDAVIGHHPHVLQPVEEYTASDGRFCAIFYSLGNFISNQTRTSTFHDSSLVLSTEDSAVIRITIKKHFFSKKTRASFHVIPTVTHRVLDKKNKAFDMQAMSVHKAISILNNKKKQMETGRDIIDRKLINLYNKLKAIEWALFRGKTFRHITFEQ